MSSYVSRFMLSQWLFNGSTMEKIGLGVGEILSMTICMGLWKLFVLYIFKFHISQKHTGILSFGSQLMLCSKMDFSRDASNSYTYIWIRQLGVWYTNQPFSFSFKLRLWMLVLGVEHWNHLICRIGKRAVVQSPVEFWYQTSNRWCLMRVIENFFRKNFQAETCTDANSWSSFSKDIRLV